MATVLHISASGTVLWEKSVQGWALASGEVKGPVWVVTDLSEEAFVEITVPRIFGTDRSNFVQRQLANRFPDTVFRVALPTRSTGGLMERLAPPLQTLTAIDPAERVQAALKSLQVPLAGVWSTSMLLTKLGRAASLPRSLFVVLCQGSSMRILFLKDRVPVLTRLVSVADTAAEQAAEVVRTLRHLENTRVIDRGNHRYGVLLLGGRGGLDAILARDRIDALPTPVHADTDADWSHHLFDLVCKSPPGQLAPLSLRASYLAIGVTKAARVGVVLALAAALWIASNNIGISLRAQRDTVQINATMAQTAEEIAKVDAAIQAFGVSPDQVRKALAVDTEEVVSAPRLDADMVNLSKVIAGVPGVRLKSMQWTVLGPNEPACVVEGSVSTPPAPATPEVAATDQPGAEPAPPSRKVELQMAVLMTEGAGPRQLLQQAADISQRLAKMPGAVVLRDPARSLREGDIRVGTLRSETARDFVWCATLPGARHE